MVPITWERKTMSDYAREFVNTYTINKTTTNYVLGFSYGAVVALITANALKPKKIYLCSLSPDFKEDVSTMSPWIRKYIGKNRLSDIQKRNAREIARKLKVQSVVFYGDAEGKLYPQLKIRCEKTVKIASRSKLVVVKDAPHKMNHHNYQEAIMSELKLV